jgi:hypothetical protein
MKRYATLMRPPQPGAIPRNGLQGIHDGEFVTPSGHHAWGWVEYNRQLTDEEISGYELEEITGGNNGQCTIAERV